MFATEARRYIEKLIRLQAKIEGKGYRRVDQGAVRQSREHLRRYLDYYKYETDEQMHRFWETNQQRIRNLIPSENHPAYQKLLNEYITLTHHESK